MRFGSTRGGRRLELTSSWKQRGPEPQRRTWAEVVEETYQFTLRSWFDRGNHNSELIATLFLRQLSEAAHRAAEGQQEGERRPPSELLLFANPLRAFQFQLRDRRYVGIDVSRMLCESIRRDEVRRARRHELEQQRASLLPVLRWLHNYVKDEIGVLARSATPLEPLRVLLEHLSEGWGQAHLAPQGGQVPADGDPAQFSRELHPARRAALKSWENRLERQIGRRFDHEEADPLLYSYPFVDLIPLSGQYMAVMVFAPLDLTFVDEKVRDYQRVSDISLVIYDTSRCGDWRRHALPQLRQCLSRLIFARRSHENYEALSASFGEHSSIERHWYQIAANERQLQPDGSRGFDGLAFGEAIVRQLLCTVEGVTKTEVFRFDRAFIFREAGNSSEIHDLPMEMLVLEASIQSENPADRGQALTRRERRLRGTEDYECNPARKTLQADDRINFYLHSHARGLAVSRKESLGPLEAESAFLPSGRSSIAAHADERAYGISLPPDLYDPHPISMGVVNLVGRLLREERVEKEVEILGPDKQVEWVRTKTFTTEFEQLHLEVLQRADDEGFTFEYAHGINLEQAAPLLWEIQSRYFDYLRDRYRAEDRLLLEERALEENLNPEQSRSFARLQEQRGAAALRPLATENAKVVLISFSANLHDENMQRYREAERRLMDRRSRKGAGARPILGSEYTFTIMLVSDDDGDKSLPELERERTGFRSVLRTIVRELWTDKLRERQYLERRSESIGHCLNQFLHRAKALIPAEGGGRQELDELFKGLNKLIQPARAEPRQVVLDSSLEVLADVLGVHSAQPTWEQIRAALTARGEHVKHHAGVQRSLEIELSSGGVTLLELTWEEVVIRDAFEVAWKNACEAALLHTAEGETPTVSLGVEVVPISLDRAQGEGFLEIVVENTGGPIPQERLAELTAAEPSPVSRDDGKASSTGIGVFLSRYQLRQTLQGGADYLIQNLERGRVCTRIRLPVRFISREAPARADHELDQTSHERAPSRYVLYVEDQQVNYVETRGALEAFLSPRGYELRHARGLERAQRLVEQSLPVLVLTDLQIASKEDDTAPVQPKFGTSLLKAVLRTTHAREIRPPVWVVSAEEESEVLKQIPEVVGFGYEVVPPTASPPALVREGALAVFGSKRPFHEGEATRIRFEVLLDALMERLSSDGRGVSESAEASSSTPCSGIALEALNFAEDLERSHLDPDRAGLLTVEASASDVEQLALALGRWFSHPGLPDPDLPWEPDRFPLHNTDHHTQMLLFVRADRGLYDSLPPALRFWALTHNTWLCAADSAPSAARRGEAWAALRQHGRGPLSVLRHDIRNEWAGKVLQATRTQLLEAAVRAEELLGLGRPQDLAAALAGGQVGVADALRALLERSEYPDPHRLAILELLQEVDRLLVVGSELSPTVGESAEKHRLMLSALRDVLGLDR